MSLPLKINAKHLGILTGNSSKQLFFFFFIFSCIWKIFIHCIFKHLEVHWFFSKREVLFFYTKLKLKDKKRDNRDKKLALWSWNFPERCKGSSGFSYLCRCWAWAFLFLILRQFTGSWVWEKPPWRQIIVSEILCTQLHGSIGEKLFKIYKFKMS